MMPIALQPTPKQNPQFYADGQQYNIRVWWDGDDMMFMDVTINGTVIATSLPCIVNQQVMPYDYMEGVGGNFFWQTASGGNPIYTNFGGNDVLLYASAAEMASARATIVAELNTITLAPNQAN